MEAMGLVVSPYTNPFYSDGLAPLLAQAFPAEDVAALNAAATPRLFVTATDVTSNGRAIFTQPDISTDAIRASACLPTEFKAVTIGDAVYWDGGYLGNPALSPLLEHAQDLMLVLVNAFHRDAMPPHSAPAILDRAQRDHASTHPSCWRSTLSRRSIACSPSWRQRACLMPDATSRSACMPIRNDAFVEQLGFVSKNSTSWDFLSRLHDAGYQTAETWLGAHLGEIGSRSSFDVKAELTDRVLKAPPGTMAALPPLPCTTRSRATANRRLQPRAGDRSLCGCPSQPAGQRKQAAVLPGEPAACRADGAAWQRADDGSSIVAMRVASLQLAPSKWPQPWPMQGAAMRITSRVPRGRRCQDLRRNRLRLAQVTDAESGILGGSHHAEHLGIGHVWLCTGTEDWSLGRSSPWFDDLLWSERAGGARGCAAGARTVTAPKRSAPRLQVGASAGTGRRA